MKRNDEEKNHELKKKKNQISRKGYIFFCVSNFSDVCETYLDR